MREYQTHYTPEIALAFAATTADRNGAIIDRKDCNGLDFVCGTGAVTTADATNFFSFVLYESDDPGMAGATAVAAANLVVDGTPGGTPVKVNDAANQANKIITQISYIGTMRYLRLTADETLTADAELWAIVNRFYLAKAPA